MHLHNNLQNQYTEDRLSARDAQQMAFLYAWGPAVFQTARLLVEWGILEQIDNAQCSMHDDGSPVHRFTDSPVTGLTIDEVAEKTGQSRLSVACLMEAGLTTRILLIDPETERYRLSKIGWFLLHDEMIHVDQTFCQQVNYEGMFRMDEALRTNQPVGLEHFGSWPTIYEALSNLPQPVREAWLNYDHYFSDNSFDEALNIVFATPKKTLLDIGGNTGEFALKCVQKDPQVQVTVCDLPQQITMMRQAIKGHEGADRISGLGMDLLDDNNRFPQQYDAIWMSQFIMCFTDEDILRILARTKDAMTEDSRLYLMEVMWNRQAFPSAAFCQTMNSLYFATMAAGNTKMHSSDEVVTLLHKAGLQVEQIHDNMGPGGHSLMVVKKINE